MSLAGFTESVVEDAAPAWLEGAGWQVAYGSEIAPDMLYRRGIIETWGRGTLNIARLLQEAGHAPAEVAVREGAVVVTFALPGKTPGKTPAEILRLLTEEPALSVPQLAARLGKSESAVNRAIRTLRESGRLVRIGPDKGGQWRVIE